MKTPDDRNDAAALSIEDVLRQDVGMGDQEVMGEWMAIVSTQRLYGDATVTQYYMVFSGGEMVPHHAMGLVEKARTLMEDPGFMEQVPE